MISHRSDIDGLRSIAVLAVVAFHCGFAKFLPGGFVGVDVFFVISGFLITKIIITGAETGTFSILEFYSRRAKRILPAVVVMYSFVMIAAYFTMLPSDSLHIFKSIVSSSFFSSNVFFYLSSGYFDDASEQNPVLHTWSLSVEEQFYVFFPFLIIMAASYGRRSIQWMILAAAALSLAASIIAIRWDQSAVFYLVHYRAWELMAGSFIAANIVGRPSDHRWTSAISILGALMIAGSMLLLTERSQFPGLAALPVTVGTALIIWSGPSTLVSRILSVRPAQFIGKISYSLYLWHWPIWVFATQDGILSKPEAGTVVLASLLAAYISWRFVEEPFRRMTYRPKVMVSGGAISIAAVCAFATTGQIATAEAIDENPSVSRMAEFQEYDPTSAFRSGKCFLTSSDTFEKFDKEGCLAFSKTKKNVLLLGDSHAAHLYPGLEALADINILQSNASGCRPVVGSDGEDRCLELMSFVFDEFLPSHPVDEILIAGRWQKRDVQAVRKTVDKLAPYANKIVVVGPVVEYRSSLPRLLAKAMYVGHDIDATEMVVPRQRIGLSIEEALKGSKASYISVYKTMCHPTCVLTTDRGDPLQFDYGHFTADGSRLFVAKVADKLMP